MVINFLIGDVLVVRQSYVDGTLANVSLEIGGVSRASNVRATLTLLGQLNHQPATVAETGTVVTFLDDGETSITRSFIRVVPTNTQNPVYNAGQGAIIYWEDDTTINNMFELSTAFLVDLQYSRAFNSSGVTLNKGLLVRVTGFNVANQVPTIALADATVTANSAVFGILEETVLNGELATVLTNGHYQGLDTTGFSLNGIVFLSDTPGGISSVAGTVTSILGRVINVASTAGAIAIRGVIPLGSGSGGGSGATGLVGTTGIQGNTGIQGLGVTGLQGTTGLSGNTGIQGLGVTGLQGITGLIGATGLTGTTGIQGLTGLVGVTGLQGPTGIQGGTGVQGLGVTGLQGLTGIGSAGSGVQRLATVSNIDFIAGTTNIAIYTVPALTTAVITGVIVRITAANGITAVPAAGVGFNVAADDVFTSVNLIGVTAANFVWNYWVGPSAKTQLGVAGSTLLFGIDTATTGTTHLASVDVIGYTF